MAMSAGPNDPFNEANSYRVNCSSQSEINTYWDDLQKNAGEPQACGWIVNKYGVRRQIVPTVLVDMINDPDKTKAGRVVTDMQIGGKFDIAKLKKEFDGR
jgi:predicted 3-demethylubiquinone-9 3-methyltransferase (glyoxalase superfamily)